RFVQGGIAAAQGLERFEQIAGQRFQTHERLFAQTGVKEPLRFQKPHPDWDQLHRCSDFVWLMVQELEIPRQKRIQSFAIGAEQVLVSPKLLYRPPLLSHRPERRIEHTLAVFQLARASPDDKVKYLTARQIGFCPSNAFDAMRGIDELKSQIVKVDF